MAKFLIFLWYDQIYARHGKKLLTIFGNYPDHYVSANFACG